jgi:diguanylate cyclase (GGDEF)-like protein
MYGGDHTAAFDAAMQALHSGQTLQARALATHLLSQAKSAGDLLTQARTFHLLARIEHQHADLSAALSLARQSAHLLHVLNIPLEESTALSHIAHLATLLGLSEEAVESATLSVQLADTLPPGPHTVDAYNYLGVASTWVDVVHADTVLRKAIALAEHLLTPQAAARPMVNRLINELYRLELCLQRNLPAEVQPAIQEQLVQYAALVQQLERGQDTPAPLSPAILQATLHTARAGLLAFSGHSASALEAAHRIPFEAVPTWMRGFMYFVQARCQLAAGQWEAALHTTRQTLDIAEHQGQLNFVLLSRYQRMEAFEALGDAGRLMEEFRAFRTHQLRQQAEVIVSRERVASLRMAWREQTLALEALHSSTRALERLTLEDPLTGLANRRQLEHKLDELLSPHPAQAPAPWCLAMIDIDGFKQINDRFSHVLGDNVLRQVATLLREIVQQQDLAVRLAGDEFVLILRDTTEALGLQVVERLNRIVAQFPWTTLQQGLCVRVSTGLAQAHPGDTSESLLRRSDLRMYADKLAP